MDMYLWRCLSVLISTIQLATIPLLQAQESTPGGVLNPQNNVFNVTDYGIAPNSQEDALPALKKALRKAEKYVKASQQNAEVYFPSGSYNLSPCEVKLNNVNIHLGANAQIMALPKMDIPNPPSSYITFKGKNFVLYSEEGSLFDGNGATWWRGGEGSVPTLLA